MKRSPPGETIQDMLDERGMTQADLARSLGRPFKTINEIIKGKARITEEMAMQLEQAFKVDAEFWLLREAQYRLSLLRK